MFQRFFAMFCGFNSRESEGLMSEGLILLSDADYL